jgi:diaminopimelate epimerase
MRIEFTKMHGLGNDFIVFDAPQAAGAEVITADTVRALADRHTGIGFDQALMLEPPRRSQSRASYRIFNADGGEVEQCGNGARCVAAFMVARFPELGKDLALDSKGGVVHARVHGDGSVAVDMGIPNFEPSSLPMEGSRVEPCYVLEVDAAPVEFGAVSMGNPHAVLLVDDVSTAPVTRLGPAIEGHPRFARRTNVGFMQIIDTAQIALRVFERGVGETLACGTGACAAVAIGRMRGLLGPKVRVHLPGGTALVSWAGPGDPIWLTGPATTVFSGSIDI